MAKEAEDLGVEIYPGFAASELLYTPDGAVCGIATKGNIVGNNHFSMLTSLSVRCWNRKGWQTYIKFYARNGVACTCYVAGGGM